MRIRKFTIIILAAALAVVFACCSALNSAPESRAPDYTEITTLIKSYEDAYRSFIRGGDGEMEAVTASGHTPDGAPCESLYTRSSDGIYESCSLTVDRDGREEHDEYFNISPDMMMFVRTCIDTETPNIDIRKYIVSGNGVYYINDETESCENVEDITSLDIFVTFEQVRTAYGISEDS